MPPYKGKGKLGKVVNCADQVSFASSKKTLCNFHIKALKPQQSLINPHRAQRDNRVGSHFSVGFNADTRMLLG